MDTSETYLRMCEKAWEIQEIYCKNPNMEFPLLHNIFVIGYGKGKWNVWLPRQDQLFEMCNWESFDGIVIAKIWNSSFSMDVEFDRNQKYRFESDSIEKLLLSLVMKENHCKTWNGDNWVKVTGLRGDHKQEVNCEISAVQNKINFKAGK